MSELILVPVRAEERSRWQRLPQPLQYVVEHYKVLTPPAGVRELNEVQERVRQTAGMLILLGNQTWPHVFHRPATVDLWSRLAPRVLDSIPRDELRASADEYEQAAWDQFDPSKIHPLPVVHRTNEALHAAAAWLHAHPEQLAACEARPERM